MFFYLYNYQIYFLGEIGSKSLSRGLPSQSLSASTMFTLEHGLALLAGTSCELTEKLWAFLVVAVSGSPAPVVPKPVLITDLCDLGSQGLPWHSA